MELSWAPSFFGRLLLRPCLSVAELCAGHGEPCFATLSLREATHEHEGQNPMAHTPRQEKEPELCSGEGSHFWVSSCVMPDLD